jgi:hypothetical protein
MQGRIDVLSRPQIMTVDNQVANINVGQLVPFPTGATITTFGVVPTFTFQQVGIGMTVTPRISPDGRVIMRVTPQVSRISNAPQVQLGGGVSASIIDSEALDTTVSAMDGETVAIGGLINKRDIKNENKIPWLGDLPGVGVLFRYRTYAKEKREMLVIMTPHIVRNRFEAERVLAMESQRMDWILGDVVRTQGTSGMGPVISPAQYLPPAPPAGGGSCPAPAPFYPGLAPTGPDQGESLPLPAIAPPGPPQGPGGPPVYPPPAPSAGAPPLTPDQAWQSGQTLPPAFPPAENGEVAPAEPRKESSKWNLFRRK